jgi:hypothetical protein
MRLQPVMCSKRIFETFRSWFGAYGIAAALPVESGRAQVGERLKPTDCKSVRLLAFGGSNPPLCTSIPLARLVRPAPAVR